MAAGATTNSNGQPIHPTEEGIRNFWRWFGDSKVVDDDGRPLVVYHGTDKKFYKINLKKGAQGLFWFTSDKSAIEAGEVGAAGRGVTMEMYAKIDNPADWKQYDNLMLDEFKSRGLDGAVLPEKDGTIVGFIIDRPTQIKSATGNNGQFDPANPDIRYSLPRAGMRDFLLGPVVAKVNRGAISAKDGERPSDAAYRWLKDHPQAPFARDDIGEIVFDRNGLENSLQHKFGWQKLNAVAAIPDVLHKGIVIEASQDASGKPLRHTMLAAPINIDGERYQMVIRLRQDSRGSNPHRFYVHEVVLEKDVAAPIKTGAEPIEGLGRTGGRDHIHRILRDILNFKDVKRSTPRAQAGEASQPFTLEVTPKDGQRFRDGVTAVDEDDAIRFARFLWPDADVRVLAQRAFVPDLRYSVARLNSAIEKQEGVSDAFSVGTQKDNRLATAFRRVFGAELIPIVPNVPEAENFLAMTFDGRLYVNTENPKHGFVHLAGHELLHDLAQKQPGIYSYFANAARDYLVPDAESSYADRLSAVGAEADTYQEVLADLTGDALADKDFLSLLKEANPERFTEFADYVTGWLDDVSDGLTRQGFESSQYVRDIQSLRETLAAVLDAYADVANPDIRYSTKRGEIDRNFEAAVRAHFKSENPQLVRMSDNTPASLQMFGWKDAPVAVQPNVLNKMLYDHGMKPSEIAKMPELLRHPTMMFGDEKNESIVFAGQQMREGRPSLVAVKPVKGSSSTGRQDVTMVVTGYEPATGWDEIVKRVMRGELVYRNTEDKIPSAVSSAIVAAQKKFAQNTDRLLPRELLQGRGASVTERAYKVLGQSDLVKHESDLWGDEPQFSTPRQPAAFQLQETDRLDNVIYKLQDKQIDLRRVVQAIRETGKKIDDIWNPYLQEELYHGRSAKAVKDFNDFELRPLLQDMQMRGVSMADLEAYLHNRHAEEANRHIAKINPNDPEMQDGGSQSTLAFCRRGFAGFIGFGDVQQKNCQCSESEQKGCRLIAER